MAHNNTVFAQLLKLIPRHEVETLSKQYHSGRSFRKNSRWSQLTAMMMGQISGRNSLRDMIDNLGAQVHRLYHLGSNALSRSSLSRINNDKPYTLYEALFGQLLSAVSSRYQGMIFVLTTRCTH